jgi:AcrR family transcriptional regulator
MTPKMTKKSGESPGTMDDAQEPSMARRYVDAALAHIDKGGGAGGLNLRELSRTIGCAHTNAYNYFGSSDELVWHSLVGALARLMQHTLDAMARAGVDTGARLEAFVGSQVEFAMAHPGWYRLIWLDPLPGAPPPALVPALSEPRVLFAEIIAKLAPPALGEEQARHVADILHNYLHGALSKLVAERLPSGIPSSPAADIVADARLLLGLLTNELRSARNSHSQKGDLP